MSVLRLDDYSVPGHSLKISLGMDFKSEDASGESSSTARASKGTKGKKLEVKLLIRFEDEHLLRELVNFAENKEKGEGKLYTITNATANAAGMRQGRFSGAFKIDEQDNLMQWGVSFSLSEHVSVPERAESRQSMPGQTTQTNEGEEVGGEGGGEEAPRELNLAEKALKAADDFLSGKEETPPQ